eukprot:2335889-Lingulodinium_polyedra.AAC.1
MYADVLFLDGYSSGEGTKLLVAVEAVHPVYLRKGRLAVPRFRRALKGWGRLAPTRSRVPCPEAFAVALAE